MQESSPKSVALHFGTCTAFALAAAAAPFVPEAIAGYAGYRYLRSFRYGSRPWHAPARVPLHLGRRGYRDASTGMRGSATWPIGTTLSDRLQIWLGTEDLRHGCIHIGPEPTWLREAAETMTFGACLNQMGVLVIDDWTAPSMSARLGRVAAPFGRDTGLITVDLTDPLSNTLRISAAALIGALRANSVSEPAIKVVEALAPILALIGRRYAMDPLTLYPVYLRGEALVKLAKGQYEIGGSTVDAKMTKTADGQAFMDVCGDLETIKEDQLEKACRELAPFARELAMTRGLSLSRGFDLKAALHIGRMTYIRPASALTRHIVLKTCIEALSDGELPNVVIHVACLNAPHFGQLEVFRTRALKAKAIPSIAVLDRDKKAYQSDLLMKCVLRFQGANPDAGTPHFVESKIKNCQFGLEYKPMAISSDPGMVVPAMHRVTTEQAQIRAEEDAKADAPMARAKPKRRWAASQWLRQPNEQPKVEA